MLGSALVIGVLNLLEQDGIYTIRYNVAATDVCNMC